MMITTKNTSDLKVFGQMFKSFGMQNLDVAKPDEIVFDGNGYLKETVYLGWSGSVEDGLRIKQLIEAFGYSVDWDGDRARKIGVIPVSESELSLR